MMTFSRCKLKTKLALVFGVEILLLGGVPGNRLLFAQDSSSQSSGTETRQVSPDEYDRPTQVWYTTRMGKSGWERGQELYYMKCWICHNDYTIKAEPAAIPTLRNLYKRRTLLSGQPVNDETVKTHILNGSPGMPSYKYSLSDKDLLDLVTYLREKCCWDENNPPANPRYRAQ